MLPRYIGCYHRFMRHLVAVVAVFVSCLSLLLGFYDLPLGKISMLQGSVGPCDRNSLLSSTFFSL